VLRQLCRLGAQTARAGLDDRAHAVGAPATGGPAQPLQQTVESGDQVREALALGEHDADPARRRESPDQHVSRLAPRRLRQLEPVELELPAGLVYELDRHPPPVALADLAHRPQLKPAQLPRQRRVRALEPQRPQLPQQHRRVQMRIVTETLSDVIAERLQRARAAARLTIALAPQPRPYRLAVPTRVARDRAHRPTPPIQRNDFHHVLP
jgi:hypothetical protein